MLSPMRHRTTCTRNISWGAVIGTTLLIGCTTAQVTPEGSQVRIIPWTPTGCKSLGPIKVQGAYFPSSETMEGYLRNEAAEKYGANAIVVTGSDNLGILYTKTADAYYCANREQLIVTTSETPKPSGPDTWFLMLELGSGVGSYLGGEQSALQGFGGFHSISGLDLQTSIGFYVNASLEKNWIIGGAITPIVDFSGRGISSDGNLQSGLFGLSSFRFYGPRQAHGPYLRGDAGLSLAQVYVGSTNTATGVGPGVLAEAGYSFGGGKVMDSYVGYETAKYGVSSDANFETKWRMLAYGRIDLSYCLSTMISQFGVGLGVMY